MKSFEQIAKAMYEAYRESRGNVMLALWHKLSQDHQNAWIDAAKAAHKEITEVQ